MKRLAFLQHGDFREDYTRLTGGGPETYRDQARSVAYAASLAERYDVTVYAFKTDFAETRLAPRLKVVYLPPNGQRSRDAARRIFETPPDRFVCRTPHVEILEAAVAAAVPTLATLADIFETPALRKRLRQRRLRKALLSPEITAVANHSLNASRSVIDVLGIPPRKVIPWDWSQVPPDPHAKSAPDTLNAPSLFYAGALREAKGVGDCLSALADLRHRGIAATMTFAGGGDLAAWRKRAAEMGLGEAASFIGLVPNADVRGLMRDHDMVVVPSRHDYAEGLPNTIYEALAARSPLLISDHPAFAGRLQAESECLVFKAASPASLSRAVETLVRTPGLYDRLSRNAPEGLSRLYFGIELTELIDRYLADPRNETGWVSDLSYAALTAPA